MAKSMQGSPFLLDDVTNGVVGIKSPNGTEQMFGRYSLTNGTWASAPSVFRLRLTGTGTVVIDSRDALGVESLAVATFIASAATNQIEFPYLGDAAVALRATFPNTMTVEVL
jgi:hypothetical protein